MSKLSFRWMLPLLSGLVLLGCANPEVKIMAEHRASVIAAGLPYKYGPLNVMSTKSKGNTVEILMIYNNDGKTDLEALVNKSIETFCSDNEVRSVIDKGVIYQIQVRNERGQLIKEQRADSETCEAKDEEKDTEQQDEQQSKQAQ